MSMTMCRTLAAGMVLLLLGLNGCQTPANASSKTPANTANSTVNPPGQDPRLALFFARRDRATELVLAASHSPDPLLRTHAMEAIQDLPQQAPALARQGMMDANPAVRFAALVAVGKLRLASVAPAAQDLQSDPDESVRAAAIYTLHRNHLPANMNVLAGMTHSPSHTTRGNVAMLLGLMGEPSAIPMLRDMARRDVPRTTPVQETIVRLQITEAVLRLGDDSALDSLRAYAVYSPFDEVRVAAVEMIGQLNDRRFITAITPLVQGPPVELQLAAAGVLARFGRQDGLAAALPTVQSASAPQRVQTAMTLGLFPHARAAQAVVGLLEDPDATVRLAAATMVLRYCSGQGG